MRASIPGSDAPTHRFPSEILSTTLNCFGQWLFPRYSHPVSGRNLCTIRPLIAAAELGLEPAAAKRAARRNARAAFLLRVVALLSIQPRTRLSCAETFGHWCADSPRS